jgi:hypothetical protein
MLQALRKTAVGQLMLFPTYVTAFFLAMGLLEGRGLAGGCDKLQAAFLPTITSGSVFW